MLTSNFLRILLGASFLLYESIIYGCASEGQYTRFYVLDPISAGVPLVKNSDQENPLSIEIVSLRLPQYLERPQIVTRNEENEIKLAELHQWGGNLQKNMVRVITKNLSCLLQTPDVSGYPRNPQSPPAFRIELVIMKFERDQDGRVRLSTQWRLSRGKDDFPLAVRMTELESSSLEPDWSMEKTVSAMNLLMCDLCRIIGKEIIKYK